MPRKEQEDLGRYFSLVLLHMAPCHSLPLKESCEVCAERGRYQIGESLTKNQPIKGPVSWTCPLGMLAIMTRWMPMVM